MKINKILFIVCFLTAFLGICYSQEFPEKDKKYDEQIYEFLNAQTEDVSLVDFLINSKPFNKWDMRPLSRDRVWVFDTIHTAGEIPNFFWGAFANKYKLTSKEGMEYPNLFLKYAMTASTAGSRYMNEHNTKFDVLSQKIISGSNTYYITQNELQRVDEIYKEGEQYWKYVIPVGSPFPISDKVDSAVTTKFSEEQIAILSLLKEINMYAAVKTANGIFYLMDGFTDNSYGFYYSYDGKMEESNFLFNIMKSERLNSNYYFYIAN